MGGDGKGKGRGEKSWGKGGAAPMFVDRPWQEVREELIAQKHMHPSDLDSVVMDLLGRLPTVNANEAMAKFADAVQRGTVSNKGGFMMGILRTRQVDLGLPKGKGDKG